MHTTQQIIDNQEKYNKEIIYWLKNDLKKTKVELVKIKSDDEIINKNKEKLKHKLNKMKFKNVWEKLFFMHPKRNDKYYVWWDNDEKEAIILNYGKK